MFQPIFLSTIDVVAAGWLECDWKIYCRALPACHPCIVPWVGACESQGPGLSGGSVSQWRRAGKVDGTRARGIEGGTISCCRAIDREASIGAGGGPRVSKGRAVAQQQVGRGCRGLAQGIRIGHHVERADAQGAPADRGRASVGVRAGEEQGAIASFGQAGGGAVGNDAADGQGVGADGDGAGACG